MVGAPSQLELFDYKPELAKLHNKPCPESLLKGKKFAFIRGVPKMLGPQAVFSKEGANFSTPFIIFTGPDSTGLRFCIIVHGSEF